MVKKYALTDEWLKLGHYQKKFNGDYESQLEGEGFFLAQNGKYDPEAELISTIELFMHDDSKGIKNARNRFPARLKFISGKFAIPEKKVECKELDEYLKNTGNRNISIVYSSYFMNNPASIFGHTFIKLDGGRTELLEYGINFTADTSRKGFFPYIINGLSGFYPGKYSLVQFFDKVREYNNFENRDLWIYTLRLDADQKDTLVKHIWELMQSYYPYYFLTKNCAYHSLSELDPVFSDYRISDGMKYFVIPVDTIKLLYARNLVSGFSYMPSLRNIFLQKYGILTGDKRDEFHNIIKSRMLSGEVDAEVLDALIAYYNYKYPLGSLDVHESSENADIFAFKNTLVDTRSLKVQNAVSDFKHGAEINPPHLMHGSERIALYSGMIDGTRYDYVRTEYRFAYHDMADSSRGYPSNTEIEMGKVSFDLVRHDSKNKAYVNELSLLKISAYNDISFHQSAPSWSIYSGVSRTHDSRSKYDRGSLAPTINAAIGASQIFSKDGRNDYFPGLIVYTMLGTSLSYSSDYKGVHASAGAGPIAGFKFSFLDNANILGSGSYMKFAKSVTVMTVTLQLRYTFPLDIAADLYYSKNQTGNEMRLGLLKYF